MRARALCSREGRIPDFAIGIEVHVQCWDVAGAWGNRVSLMMKRGAGRSIPLTLQCCTHSVSVPPSAPGTL